MENLEQYTWIDEPEERQSATRDDELQPTVPMRVRTRIRAGQVTTIDSSGVGE